MHAGTVKKLTAKHSNVFTVKVIVQTSVEKLNHSRKLQNCKGKGCKTPVTELVLKKLNFAKKQWTSQFKTTKLHILLQVWGIPFFQPFPIKVLSPVWDVISRTKTLTRAMKEFLGRLRIYFYKYILTDFKEYSDKIYWTSSSLHPYWAL